MGHTDNCQPLKGPPHNPQKPKDSVHASVRDVLVELVVQGVYVVVADWCML